MSEGGEEGRSAVVGIERDNESISPELNLSD